MCSAPSNMWEVPPRWVLVNDVHKKVRKRYLKNVRKFYFLLALKFLLTFYLISTHCALDLLPTTTKVLLLLLYVFCWMFKTHKQLKFYKWCRSFVATWGHLLKSNPRPTKILQLTYYCGRLRSNEIFNQINCFTRHSKKKNAFFLFLNWRRINKILKNNLHKFFAEYIILNFLKRWQVPFTCWCLLLCSFTIKSTLNVTNYYCALVVEAVGKNVYY